MMKNKETTLKGVILLMSIAAVFTLMFNSVSAVTNNTSAATASAEVLATISVTLSGGPVTFTNLNAGTYNNTPAAPLNISIDLGTNVKTNISQNSSDFTDCSGCGDTIPISNLRYANASDLPNSTVMTTTFPAPPYANWENITKPSTDNVYNDVYYWLTIPNGTTPATYTTSIYINVTAYQ